MVIVELTIIFFCSQQGFSRSTSHKISHGVSVEAIEASLIALEKGQRSSSHNLIMPRVMKPTASMSNAATHKKGTEEEAD